MSCNIIENTIMSRHTLCMETSSGYHVCHMTKKILNEKKYVKTCVVIWMFYHANYVPYITKSNQTASYLIRRTETIRMFYHTNYVPLIKRANWIVTYLTRRKETWLSCVLSRKSLSMKYVQFSSRYEVATKYQFMRFS